MNAFVPLVRGTRVRALGKAYEIDCVIDIDSVVVVREDTGNKEIVRVADIEPAAKDPATSDYQSLAWVSDAHWDTARRRFEAISPLLGRTRLSRSDVDKVAEQWGVSSSTIYRWIRRYQTTRDLMGLVPSPRHGGKDKARIGDEVEQVIRHFIQHHYLTAQKPLGIEVWKKVRVACKQQGLPVPHPNTVRKRIQKVSARVRAQRRGERKEVERLEAVPGSFPQPNYPMEVVQIDHTPLDMIVVDDVLRRPIGRPWVTVAIDVYSRVIVGFLISLEAPSALSVGLVISQSILPKDRWLADRDLNLKWPVWGRPAVIHADNGADFRCEAVTRGCENRGIDMHWRPVKKPRYGAHIERFLGTLSNELRNVRGATFSNPKERGDYDSDKHADVTMRELECWLANLILGAYHNRCHKTLGVAPITCYEEGLLGTADRPGKGLPARPTDARRLLIDFLPIAYRTVQRTGIEFEGVRYYAPALQKWIGVLDKVTRKSPRFEIRYDPRDASAIYFWDAEEQEYFDIPVANLAHPAVSLWEVRAARKQLREKGAKVDEAAIFHAIEEMDRIEKTAQDRTKRARRAQQRKRAHRDPANLMVEPERRIPEAHRPARLRSP